MELSKRGAEFIAKWEGFSPTAYMDENDGWTIGYGHLIRPGDGLNQNSVLTKEQALALLLSDSKAFAATVRGQITAPLSQNQFDALVSLVYNIGPGQFSSSTVRARINNYDTPEAIAEAWARWNKDDGQFVQGLANRRAEEIEMYFEPSKKKLC